MVLGSYQGHFKVFVKFDTSVKRFFLDVFTKGFTCLRLYTNVIASEVSPEFWTKDVSEHTIEFLLSNVEYGYRIRFWPLPFKKALKESQLRTQVVIIKNAYNLSYYSDS